MNLVRVIVQKQGTGDPAYVCYVDTNGWKCGSCQRGNLGYPKVGDICRVCKAVVREAIEDSPEFHIVRKYCGMCHGEISETMDLELHYKIECTMSVRESIEQRLRAIEDTLGIR